MKWEGGTDSFDFRETALTPAAYESKKAPIVVSDPRPFQEAAPEQMNLELLQNNLGNCLSIIDDELMKGYVDRLAALPILPPDEQAVQNLPDMYFFKISELVYQEEEFSIDKLSMVFHALSNRPCTLAMMLKSDGEQTDFYLGARPNGSNSAGTLFHMLKQSLLGFFPGSRITEYYDEDRKRDMQAMKMGSISSVTCVADYKQEHEFMTNKDFIQGMEKFVYAMQGKEYIAIFIADSLNRDSLLARKREYEQIYTQISPFANMQINFMVSDGTSSSDGSSSGRTINTSVTRTKGTSETVSETRTHTDGSSRTRGVTATNTDTHTDTKSSAEGTVHTAGSSEGVNSTVTNGGSIGVNVGVHAGAAIGGYAGVSASYNRSTANGTNHMDSISDSVSKTLTHGFSDSHGHSDSKSKTYGTNKSDSTAKSTGTGTSQSDAHTAGEAFSLVNTATLTNTFGTSRAVTLNAQNMTLNTVMQRIHKHLERIEECESFGMWNFAAYFTGETAAETETAANTYKSVMAGEDSGIECNAINTWNDDASIALLAPYLQNFIHPQFLYHGFSYDAKRTVAVNPSALVSTNELAIHMGLPRRSVRGLPVVEHAQFAQEVIRRKPFGDKTIFLGRVYHLGQSTAANVRLDVNSLAMHTFVTGSTGSGKSNAVYHLLAEVRKKGISFLVVEPAKGEYRNVFTDVKCFGTNPLAGEMLKMDPFSFPTGVHVLEHIDRIVEIFNVCWPMYAAMPAVLKESIEKAYVSAGWDLDLSVNEKIEGLFPTFDDVLRELRDTIHTSDYAEDTKGDYIGALSTRLKSLTNGINGRIFVSDEMDLKDLFDRSAIIDISKVGSMETKSLIMGLVVLKLQEYRMANADGMNVPLRHITVLEEAHNLLKKTSTEQSSEGSNMVGKSVEMLTNAIAEIRTYGEGFVIADQAPNLLDTAAIRNTNTKIVFRLPERVDREVTGGAIALKDPQYDELSKLPTGVAAVYQNDWQEAVLCALPKYEGYGDTLCKKQEVVPSIRRHQEENDKLLHMLIQANLPEQEKETVKRKIRDANISAKIRKNLLLNIDTRNTSYEWAVADFIKKNYDLSDVFRGTGQEHWSDLKQLCGIMTANLKDEFAGFSSDEMLKIMYYICRVQYEQYPDYHLIEKLRVAYLREKVF